MGASDLIFILGVPAVAVGAAVLFGVVLPRIKRARQRQQGITLAAFMDESIVVPPRPTRPPTPDAAPKVSPEAPKATRASATQSPFAPPLVASGGMGANWPEPIAPAEPPRLRLETISERTAVPSADLRPPNLRVHRPVDGTLQFLPGRFDIVEGRDMGQEIRFVRPPGASQVEITLGRQDGVPYRHIQLHEPTVSRLHAKLTLENTDWRLTNLSETNPASLNGTPLGASGGSAILRDGDRVEMGEVVLCFRAK